MCSGCKESGLDDSMKVVVMWCSLHTEQSLDDQCEDWRETFEFSQILWERSKVVFRIQHCLRPRF